jgi:hypothetical protein
MNADNVGMGQLGDSSRFSFEAFYEHFVMNVSRQNNFDGNIAIEPPVVPLVDCGHSPFAQGFYDKVTTKFFSDHVFSLFLDVET